MSAILFIRHAETDLAGTFCGHSNPSLNAKGRVQISELLLALRTEEIHHVYASDLARAQETGEAIAKARHLQCHVRPALREIHFGRWEGRTWEEIERLDYAYVQRWLAEYPDLPAPEGESFADFKGRVISELDCLADDAKMGTTAVVTHAGVLRIVRQHLFGLSQEESMQQLPYCSILRYTVAATGAYDVQEVSL